MNNTNEDILNMEIKLSPCARAYFMSVILEFCETFIVSDRGVENENISKD